MTALAALRLVERGELLLDADVRTRLKAWTLPDSPLLRNHPVTLRTLLTHSAGLNVGGFRGYQVGAPLPTVTQILDGVAPANNDPVRVQTTPGSRVQYSGGGFVLAQLLMTEAAGRPFPILMRELVLAPLGMTHSTYEQPLPALLHARAATGHLVDGSQVPGKWHVYPELGAANLSTTAHDLARLAITVMRADQGAPNAILGKSITADMLKAQIEHRGLGGSARGKARPAASATVAATRASVRRAIADAYRWPNPMPSTERESIVVTRAIIERFAGTYRPRNRPDLPFEIAPDGAGGLALAWTRRPREPLLVSSDGLSALDSGITFKVKETTATVVQTLTYGRMTAMRPRGWLLDAAS